jgi:hypothetical protein
MSAIQLGMFGDLYDNPTGVGVCREEGSQVQHLGPPLELDIPFNSPAFQTRCRMDGGPQWRAVSAGDVRHDWCTPCLQQAGLT